MRRNTVKHNLADGRVALGTMVFEFSTTGIARIAAAAGAEFVVFDMEHTGWSMETIRRLMTTSETGRFDPSAPKSVAVASVSPGSLTCRPPIEVISTSRT